MIVDEIKYEIGFLVVIVMGIIFVNMYILFISDMWYFKENILVLLIFIIFIMLMVGLMMKIIIEIFYWNIILFVLFMLFIVRFVFIFLLMVGIDLFIKEKILIGWIVLCGIVVLMVLSYFVKVLIDEGFKDVFILIILIFVLVFVMVCVYGFFFLWLVKKFDLLIGEEFGILFVGSNDFMVVFVFKLK